MNQIWEETLLRAQMLWKLHFQLALWVTRGITQQSSSGRFWVRWKPEWMLSVSLWSGNHKCWFHSDGTQPPTSLFFCWSRLCQEEVWAEGVLVCSLTLSSSRPWYPGWLPQLQLCLIKYTWASFSPPRPSGPLPCLCFSEAVPTPVVAFWMVIQDKPNPGLSIKYPFVLDCLLIPHLPWIIHSSLTCPRLPVNHLPAQTVHLITHLQACGPVWVPSS